MTTQSAVALTQSAEKNAVLKNTFNLLGLSMIPTAIGAWIGAQMSWGFMTASPWLSLGGMLLVMFGLLFAISKNRESSLGIVFMLIFTGVMGLLLGPAMQVAASLSNGPTLVMACALITGAIFFTASRVASNPARDFSWLRGMLFAGLLIVIAVSLLNIFLQIPALSLAISSVAILLFSAYVLYDVNAIVTGGETNYIMAATAIYLDVYNIFVHLLNLAFSLFGND